MRIHGLCFYGNCSNQYFAVIDDDYKYMWTVLGRGELLFNIKEDCFEQKNLAKESNERDRLAAMRKSW